MLDQADLQDSHDSGDLGSSQSIQDSPPAVGSQVDQYQATQVQDVSQGSETNRSWGDLGSSQSTSFHVGNQAGLFQDTTTKTQVLEELGPSESISSDAGNHTHNVFRTGDHPRALVLHLPARYLEKEVSVENERVQLNDPQNTSSKAGFPNKRTKVGGKVPSSSQVCTQIPSSSQGLENDSVKVDASPCLPGAPHIKGAELLSDSQVIKGADAPLASQVSPRLTKDDATYGHTFAPHIKGTQVPSGPQDSNDTSLVSGDALKSSPIGEGFSGAGTTGSPQGASNTHDAHEFLNRDQVRGFAPQVMSLSCLLVLLMLYYSNQTIPTCENTTQSTSLSVLPTIATTESDTRGELSDCEITTSADWYIFGAMCRWWDSEFGTPGERELQSSTPDTQGLENELASSGGNFSQNRDIFPKHINEGAASPALPVKLRNEFDTPGEVYSQHLDEVAVSPVPCLVLGNQIDTPGE